MTETRKLTNDVLKFLEKASDVYGDIKREEFSQDVYSEIVYYTKSPIEDLFYIALKIQCEAFWVNMHEFGYKAEPNETVLYCNPQQVIGKYKVDFFFEYHNEGITNLVVELDGHDFHEKDKFQRSYEKARDRYLLKNGYKVIHFTGSDVVSDPHKVVFESLSMLGIHNYQVKGLDELDLNNILRRP